MNSVHQIRGYQSQNPEINFNSTIDRKYVHRQAVNEVFITSLHQQQDDHFMTTAVLPKSHMYFNDHPKLANGKQYYDAALMLEVFRQTSICVTHKYYAVPFNTKFIFNDAKFNILNHQQLEITQANSLVVIDVKITNHKYRKNILTGYTLEMMLFIDDIPCAKKTMGIGWMEEPVWKKLRAKAESLAPFNYADIKRERCLSVGRVIPNNVVIGDMQLKDGFLTTELIVDQSYSPIFDHLLDHVPGMFIIEAFRQTALLAAYSHQRIQVNQLLFHDCDISFQQFCELSSISQCTVNLQEVVFTDCLIQIPISVLQNGIKNTVGTIILKVIS